MPAYRGPMMQGQPLQNPESNLNPGAQPPTSSPAQNGGMPPPNAVPKTVNTPRNGLGVDEQQREQHVIEHSNRQE